MRFLVHIAQTFALRLNHPKPGVEGFATIAGAEAMARGVVLSAFPLLMYRAYGDAKIVSELYFGVGILAVLTVMCVPQILRHVPRAQVYRGAMSLYLLTALLGMIGGPLTAAALCLNAMAAASSFVCYNAYVMDFVAKPDFSRLETKRLLYGGIGWTVGPFLGVGLMRLWPGAPFILSGLAGALMLLILHRMNPGNGTVIQRAAGASANPLRFLRRFFSQPRLISGWLFPLTRSCGWWVFIVYLGIYAVQMGLPDWVGGLATSTANAGLFIAPLMFGWVRRRPVREAVQTGFLLTGSCFILGTILSPYPWATIAVLLVGSLGLVLLDICGGLPFLMSVKPSERTEMSAVYSSFRDVSGIITPGVAWAVLHIAPLPAIFATCGLGMLCVWGVAGRLHPRLGERRGAPASNPVPDTLLADRQSDQMV